MLFFCFKKLKISRLDFFFSVLCPITANNVRRKPLQSLTKISLAGEEISLLPEYARTQKIQPLKERDKSLSRSMCKCVSHGLNSDILQTQMKPRRRGTSQQIEKEVKTP
ncbi:hypothetical protein CRENBAI_025368 [Crenichthys baileyi]|uniref:Uncharacterized protein n=1 Tax=Crenichthys baileyi TaxID=28760 RepID=A0AAV9RHE1_9TELE